VSYEPYCVWCNARHVARGTDCPRRDERPSPLPVEPSRLIASMEQLITDFDGADETPDGRAVIEEAKAATAEPSKARLS